MSNGFPVHIIGTGAGRAHLTDEARDIILTSDVVFGSERLSRIFGDLIEDFRTFKSPLSKTVEEINDLSKKKKVAVLVSGDPLYYSIGKYVLKVLGKDRCVIHSNVTIAQVAFARLRLPWDDAFVLSLHGRGLEALEQATLKYRKIGIYTDPENNPARIAEYLLDRGVECEGMYVLEGIGDVWERIQMLDLPQASRERFRDPNFVVLLLKGGEEKGGLPWFGMPESAFSHNNIPITKREVRAIVLSRLELVDSRLLMWDIGAGSGAVSIEASRFLPSGKIYAVEKDPARINSIQDNLRRYDVRNVELIEGLAPSCLTQLPPPDRVFIGGGGKYLNSILNFSIDAMKEQAIIVVNCVMLTSLGTACSVMESKGLRYEVVEIQVSRSRNIGDGFYLKAQNPVWLVVGEKKE